MSIDAAISRIDQILGMERQLLGPAAAAANPAALNGAGGTSPASGTGAGSFANSLASAQASSGGASVNAAGYVNPLANASVRVERIDRGVDYAGSSEGQLTAAGQAFSNLIASLGGPAGLAEGRQSTGHFP